MWLSSTSILQQNIIIGFHSSLKKSCTLQLNTGRPASTMMLRSDDHHDELF